MSVTVSKKYGTIRPCHHKPIRCTKEMRTLLTVFFGCERATTISTHSFNGAL